MFERKAGGGRSERERISGMMARRALFIASALAFLLALVGWSITLGTSGISAADAYAAVANALLPGTFDVSDQTMRIVVNLRAPRVLMAVFAGSALAIGGCLTQAMLKNPLATPYTLGVSSGAGFGAALSILFGINILGGAWGTVANAFAFSLIPIAIVFAASRARPISPTAMILCGVAVSYMFSAANTIFQFFGEANAVKSVVFWMVGDLNGVGLWSVPYVAAPMLAVFAASMLLSKRMNLMRMGDDTARGFGVNAGAMRMGSMVMACALTAATVSFTGAIGFVCLLAPQISRIFVGTDMRYLIPASALTGACMLSVADMAAKTVMAPIMLPVGAVTALVGGPVLVLMLLAGRQPGGVRD
ncbi:MAG: iron ABC transporter permease [Candidatus Methanoplasma sp.]|jgi:iron complex transport system permease protein|nr:iron ABC transporter permease [Candidatus Methanoplasma sp.]